jgi:hypothetical protein
MHATIKMNRRALGCIVVGAAGALWALGGHPAKPHDTERAPAPQGVCAIAASIAGERNPALAADLRRAAGCAAAAA